MSAEQASPTLRDQFAMAALTGLLANTDETCPGGVSIKVWSAAVAEAAWIYADAMLAARGAQ